MPNVKRLAEKILDERKHLPHTPPSLILIDLSRWGDFRAADYYLRQVAEAIAGRATPAVFVGTCVGTHEDTDGKRTHRLIERGVLVSDPAWQGTALGEHFRTAWGGADYSSSSAD